MSDEARAAAERQATFREVFSQPEYRAVYIASALSWFGDYVAKAAVTVLVYDQTQSVAMSAAAFAISYLPWLLGGPLLATVAERHPYRTVMVTADLVRMVLVGSIALVEMPAPLLLVVIFLCTLANPPSQAARSALLPMILAGDRLVVGLSVNLTTGQAAQVGGYLAGAAIAAVNPRVALAIDAGTYAASAVLIRLGVRARPPAMAAAHRSHLLRETADGFRIVFGTPVLRAIAVLVFASMLFAIVPEGLAAAWAATLGSSETGRGFSQGLIMAASPAGFIIGGLVTARLLRPDVRRALIRPFAVLAPLSLVPALFGPSAVGIAVMAAICGFSVAGMMPAANGLFVQALPHGFRARAFGVMQSGTQIMQGAAVLATGVLAEHNPIPRVVGLWSLAGVVLILLAATQWPSADRFNATAAAAARNQPGAVPAPADPLDQPVRQNGAHQGDARDVVEQVRLPGKIER
ncbi:MFS transporter [Phytohabitans houttuyneae]|uniref:MFS transporter n=1 Tax=Phytohabitans houttuyneae TaxID=1076126 RepID=A0A6V8K3T7_9ACTN|nr:MFS transporter [Phytohabitans houttuyneae]GFJ78404.1 MFS transporter [Phytohabitans houttuyneae]